MSNIENESQEIQDLFKSYVNLKNNSQKTPNGFFTNHGINPDTLRKRFERYYNKMDNIQEDIKSESIDDSFIESNKLHNDSPFVEHDKTYWYNETTGTWIFFLKSSPKPLIIQDAELKNLKSRYSNWNGVASSVNEISRDFGIPRRWLIELLRTLGITHDSDPFLESELLEKNEDELVEEILADKRRMVYQRAEMAQWKEIQDKAKKFDEMEVHIVKPLIEQFNKHLPTYKQTSTKPTNNNSNNCLVFAPTDVHIGKLPYLLNGYDPDRFEQEVYEVANNLLQKSLKENPDKIIAICGSDWFHIDNIHHSTSKLTTQAGQLYGNYHDVMTRGYKLAVKIWDMLVDTNIPIETVCIAGNHDTAFSFGLAMILEQRYRHVPHFKINYSIHSRKFTDYGNSLMVFQHGEYLSNNGKGRMKDILSTIVIDSKTQGFNYKNYSHYYNFSGHVHRKSVNFDEDNGIVDIVMPSLAVTDLWHYNEHYTGNKRSIASYIINEKSGLCNVIFENILD